MTRDGLLVCGYDGRSPQAGLWNRLPPPFTHSEVRPDVWGISYDSRRFAVGEAKTSGDIDNDHTRQQLRVFGFLQPRVVSEQCRLYVAAPASASVIMDGVLQELGLLCARHVVRLYVPDCLLDASWRAEGSELNDL